jgi:PAS domain S-box-containing protein
VAVLRSGDLAVPGTFDVPLPDPVQTEGLWLFGTVGPGWRVRCVSKTAQEVLGITSGDPIMSFVHPEDVPHLFLLLSNAAAEVTQAPARLRLRQLDGSWLLCTTLVAGLADSPLPSFAFIAHPAGAQSTVAGTRTRELEDCLRAIVRQAETTGVLEPERLPDGVPRDDLTCLSQREREIVQLLLAGERVPAIAQELFLAQSTVRNHLSTVLGKCDVRSQQELVRKLRGVGCEHRLRSTLASPSTPTREAATAGTGRDGHFVGHTGVSPPMAAGCDLWCTTPVQMTPVAADALAAVLDAAGEAIFTADRHGLITSWNPVSERLYGYPREEALGMALGALWPPELRGEYARLRARVAEGGGVRRYPTRRLHRDGGTVPVFLTVMPFVAGDGEVQGIASVCSARPAEPAAEMPSSGRHAVASCGVTGGTGAPARTARDARCESLFRQAFDVVVVTDARGEVQDVVCGGSAFSHPDRHRIGAQWSGLRPRRRPRHGDSHLASGAARAGTFRHLPAEACGRRLGVGRDGRLQCARRPSRRGDDREPA